jgi:hypothetical protein
VPQEIPHDRSPRGMSGNNVPGRSTSVLRDGVTGFGLRPQSQATAPPPLTPGPIARGEKCSKMTNTVE